MRHLLPVIAIVAVAVAVATLPARAQTFAAMVSPPRFELEAKPGETVRAVFELNNRADTGSEYLLRTADWTLSQDFNVIFADELAPGSCRPWVALERPAVLLPAGGTIRYRFEVAIPADAPAGDCRFAILIEGKEASIAKAGAVSMPMTGRIGLIVYVNVGGASANLELLRTRVVKVGERELPTLVMRNAGAAHGRVAGFLTGTDANGVNYDFNPSDFPILPGTEADVYLTPSTSTNDHPVLSFPVRVQGTIEWGQRKLKIDEQFR